MKKVIIFLLVLMIVFIPVISLAEVLPPNDGMSYYFQWYGNDDIPNLVSSNKPITIKVYGDSRELLNTYQEDLLYRQYKYIDGNWKDQWGQIMTIKVGSVGHRIWQTFNVNSSNYDIPNYAGGYFFIYPKVSQLKKATQGADFGMILRTISHGLILVSGCLILAICFRKAWAFLHNLLQH